MDSRWVILWIIRNYLYADFNRTFLKISYCTTLLRILKQEQTSMLYWTTTERLTSYHLGSSKAFVKYKSFTFPLMHKLAIWNLEGLELVFFLISFKIYGLYFVFKAGLMMIITLICGTKATLLNWTLSLKMVNGFWGVFRLTRSRWNTSAARRCIRSWCLS